MKVTRRSRRSFRGRSLVLKLTLECDIPAKLLNDFINPEDAKWLLNEDSSDDDLEAYQLVCGMNWERIPNGQLKMQYNKKVNSYLIPNILNIVYQLVKFGAHKTPQVIKTEGRQDLTITPNYEN